MSAEILPLSSAPIDDVPAVDLPRLRRRPERAPDPAGRHYRTAIAVLAERRHHPLAAA